MTDHEEAIGLARQRAAQLRATANRKQQHRAGWSEAESAAYARGLWDAAALIDAALDPMPLDRRSEAPPVWVRLDDDGSTPIAVRHPCPKCADMGGAYGHTFLEQCGLDMRQARCRTCGTTIRTTVKERR